MYSVATVAIPNIYIIMISEEQKFAICSTSFVLNNLIVLNFVHVACTVRCEHFVSHCFVYEMYENKDYYYYY